MEMIDRDAALGFDIPIPDGCNFVEISMPRDVMHFYKRVRQAHPNAANLPPMVEVARGTAEHFIAVLRGGVVYVKEDPLNPTVIEDSAPDHIRVIYQSNVGATQS
jgi:hypothetical protein